MPTFESIILSAPTGFVSGCSAILKLKIDDLTILIANILSKVKSGAQLDKQDPASRTIAFLAHARAQATPKPSATEVASTLDSNTVLTREIIAALVTSFDSSDTETVTLLTDTVFHIIAPSIHLN